MSTPVTTQITLDWPHDPRFRSVGRLVLGGVAARLDVPVDRVEELGLALDSLSRAPVADERLHLEVDVLSDRLCLTVGPFAADPLADSAIRRVVAPLVDEVDSRVTSEGHHAVLTVLLSEQPAE